MARLRPTLRATPTAGVEQKTPMLTPGIANDALSDATARSHMETSWQPAAVAMPCTRAMTGCGISVIFIIIRLQSSKSLVCQAWSSECARISLRSWPAQNPGPVPASTTTRAAGSAPTSASATSSAAIISRERGLKRSPRFRVSVAMPPLSLRVTRGVATAAGMDDGMGDPPPEPISMNACRCAGKAGATARSIQSSTETRSRTGDVDAGLELGLTAGETEQALQNASSVASLMLTTEAMVAEKPKDKEEASMPGGGHGMGM